MPFGAVLVAPDGETVLMSQGNVDIVNHAESTLCRRAYAELGLTSLERAKCTLYTTVEPCAMCAGTQYWAGIGRCVFGITEARLLELTGASEENPTMSLPCREVFARGQRPTEVLGPISEVEEEIVSVHRAHWSRSRQSSRCPPRRGRRPMVKAIQLLQLRPTLRRGRPCRQPCIWGGLRDSAGAFPPAREDASAAACRGWSLRMGNCFAQAEPPWAAVREAVSCKDSRA